MPESTADDHGAQVGGDPAGGTTAADAGDAAQGAGGGTAPAPGEGTTAAAGTEAGGEQVLQLGRSETPKEGEGAEPSGDEAKRLRDKLAFTQGRSDAFGRMSKLVEQAHPEWFKDGKFVGPSETQEGQAGTEGDESAALSLGPSGRERQAAAAERPGAREQEPGALDLRVDPSRATWDQLNDKCAKAMFEGDRVVEPVAAIVDAYLRSHGIDLKRLATMSTGQGMTPEQVQQMIARGSRQQIASYEAEVRTFSSRVDAIAAATAPEFLQQTVKFDDQPLMTLENALPLLCARTGEPDPFWAIQKDPKLGPVVQQAMVNAKALDLANQMIARGRGMQLVPGAAGFPGVGQPQGDAIDRIGGGHEPLKR